MIYSFPFKGIVFVMPLICHVARTWFVRWLNIILIPIRCFASLNSFHWVSQWIIKTLHALEENAKKHNLLTLSKCVGGIHLLLTFAYLDAFFRVIPTPMLNYHTMRCFNFPTWYCLNQLSDTTGDKKFLLLRSFICASVRTYIAFINVWYDVIPKYSQPSVDDEVPQVLNRSDDCVACLLYHRARIVMHISILKRVSLLVMSVITNQPVKVAIKKLFTKVFKGC